MRALLLLALVAGIASADPVAADLVADRESVAPGGTVRVGVRFRLERHWHVYWKNPGDSGQPPEIRWKLPEGVTASAISWPAPERIPTPPFMTFGYEGEVVMASEISVPEGYEASTLPVAADVDWLACDANGCIPGEATLSIGIPVRPRESFPISSPHPPAGELSTSVRVPKPFAEGLPVRAGEVSARYRGGRIALLAAAPGAPSFFFPAESGVIEHAAEQEAVAEGGRKGLLLTPVKTREEPVKVLRGVLAFESGPAWEVEAPVAPAAPSGKRLVWIAALGAVVFAVLAYTIGRQRKERTS